MNSPSSPRAFVIGWPIAHSKSPIIHGHWLEKYGLDGSYEKVAVAPEALGDFVSSLKEQGFTGGNVTIPHKEALLKHVDVVHPTAKKLGAANTLWFEGGELHADTTDGYGFLANLDQGAAGWDKQDGSENRGKALILGAGGACRPIILGLIERGLEEITLVNRTRQRAEDIKALFTDLDLGDKIRVEDWDDRSALCENVDLLVNTTALGMSGQPALEIDLSLLPERCLVTDIVYTPLKTDLLKQAEQRGNAIVDGLGMLLHQAVPGFEKWFGHRPEVTDELRQLALK